VYDTTPSNTRHDCCTRNLVIPYTVDLTVSISCCESVYPQALCHQTTGSCRKWAFFFKYAPYMQSEPRGDKFSQFLFCRKRITTREFAVPKPLAPHYCMYTAKCCLLYGTILRTTSPWALWTSIA
jgi:hypothetical protein